MRDPQDNKTDLSATLLAWYDAHARDLPWRIGPSARQSNVAPDPFRVWLSEIMLQQTTVATVKDYFGRFVTQWPSLADLAAAPEDDVLKAWAGLGYYSRARNLKKCADIVMAEHNGQFPKSVDGLRALPGIGDYTSAAIAAIAYNIPAAVVDGNVERVIARVFAIEAPLPGAKRVIKAHVSDLVPTNRPGDFAQAMMDLGATICTPKKPACMHCPWCAHCQALTSRHDAEHYPIKPPKKAKPLRQGAAFVAMRSDGAVFLEKRARTGLLAGMSQVPTTGWTSKIDGETEVTAAPFDAEWRFRGKIRHVFTHFELELAVWFAQVDEAPCDGWWSAKSELNGEALPTVMKKAIMCAIAD